MELTRHRPTLGQFLTALLLALAVLAYPIVGEGLTDRFGARAVASALLAITLASMIVRAALEARPMRVLGQYAGACVLLCLAAATGDRIWLLLFPAVVNLYLAVLFGATLVSEPSIVERAARSMQPHLPEFTRPYCRAVTGLWTAFFLVNVVATGWIATRSPALWRDYTTKVYLALVAALTVVEFCFRKVWFRHYGRGPVDRLFARFFPAEATERGRRSTAYVKRMHELGYGPKG